MSRLTQIGRERATIDNPSTWPLYPVLPLARTSRNWPRELGFIVAGAGPIVFKGNVLDALPRVDLSDYPTTEYETVGAILADGWEPD